MTALLTLGAGTRSGRPRTIVSRADVRPAPWLLAPAADAAAVVAGVWAVGLRPATVVLAASTWLLLALFAPTRHRIAPRVGDHAGVLIASVAAPVVLVGPFMAHHPTGPALLSNLPLMAGAVMAGRALSYAVLRRLKRRNGERTLLVGAGAEGTRLARILDAHPEFGLVPVGFVDERGDIDLPLPWLGDVTRLKETIESSGVRRVLVTLGVAQEASIVESVRRCHGADIEIYVAPPLVQLAGSWSGREVEELWGARLVRLPRAALRTPSWRAKRVVDVVGATVGLVLTAPMLTTIAVLVKVTSRGPVLFRQTRLGCGGRPIQVLKFRSMAVNGDSDTRWSVLEDHRVTRVGRVLRATSLDELPQLVNVLRGDISLVGPRPERPYFAEEFGARVPGYDQRLRVPVGMTGWAQVHGLRGDTSIAERAAFDNSYIEGWSLRRDFAILGRTIGTVLRDARSAMSRTAASPPAGATADIDLRDIPPVPTPPPAAETELLWVETCPSMPSLQESDSVIRLPDAEIDGLWASTAFPGGHPNGAAQPTAIGSSGRPEPELVPDGPGDEARSPG